MTSRDEDRCPVAPPPRSCLCSGPIRSKRVTFRQDEEEEDPGGAQMVLTPPLRPLMTLTSGLDDVTLRSQEVGVSAERPHLQEGRALTWSGPLQRSSPQCVGVSELSVVLGGLLQLVDQFWTGPGSLHRHHQFLGGAYDLLSELLQPAGGGGVTQDELVLLRRKLERTELQLERMKSRLLSVLKENYQLKHELTSGQKTETHDDL